MPLSATQEEINAYQEKVQKNNITPHDLPPCWLCGGESAFFKLHAYRERRFLVIVQMMVEAVFATLARFKCPFCGKTFTRYPDFAIPHKHYTRQTIVFFSRAYVESDHATYKKALLVDQEVPGYPDGERTLAGSTVARWISSLSCLVDTSRQALHLVLQKNPLSPIARQLAGLSVSPRKYRSIERKNTLMACRRLLMTEDIFQDLFGRSIFTNFATRCGFR
jgi:hypothetical protein